MSSLASGRNAAEYRLLYLCARQAFTAEHAVEVGRLVSAHAINWPQLFSIAQRHSVAPLVLHNLETGCPGRLPTGVARDFRLDKMQTLARKLERVRSLVDSLPWFAAHGIDLLLLKGAALDATVYAELWATWSHDYDVLLRVARDALAPHEHERIAALLPSTKGIEYDFGVHHDVTMNGVYPVDFAAVWRAARAVTWQGAVFAAPAPEDTLLMLCINSSRKRFFRLKTLCDMAETLAAHPRPDWDAVLRRATVWQCHPVLYTALRAVDLTVGRSLPADALARVDISPWRRQLVERLLPRFTPAAYATLETGRPFLGRRLAWPLLLSYATLTPRQLLRRLDHVRRVRDAGGAVVNC